MATPLYRPDRVLRLLLLREPFCEPFRDRLREPFREPFRELLLSVWYGMIIQSRLFFLVVISHTRKRIWRSNLSHVARVIQIPHWSLSKRGSPFLNLNMLKSPPMFFKEKKAEGTKRASPPALRSARGHVKIRYTVTTGLRHRGHVSTRFAQVSHKHM